MMPVVLLGLLLGVGAIPTQVAAQGLLGFAERFVPTISMPEVGGEARISALWVGIKSGTNTLPLQGVSRDLRNAFRMNKNHFFFDSMFRLQVSRFSLRIHGEPRNFVGASTYQNVLNNPAAEARLECGGVRVGMDFDLFQRGRSRLGINVDADASPPIFTESIQTSGGIRIAGETPVTVGLHLCYSPARNYCGITAVFEMCARWPFKTFSSTELNDLEIAAGLRSPETILGSVSLRGGYRRTELAFSDQQLYNGTATPCRFDAVMEGWFAELAYSY
jgi:hypothetical protein